MKQISLEAKTLRARKTLEVFGRLWDIHVETDVVLFNPEKGPWLYIAPAGQGHVSKHARWIKQINDQNFTIIANEQ